GRDIPNPGRLGAEATPARSGKGHFASAAGVRNALARSGSGRPSRLRPADLATTLRRTPGSSGCQAGGVGRAAGSSALPAMLSFSGSLKVLVAVEPCDLRKGFNGLYALVTERLGEDPRAGTLFVFSNRQHT